jgi:hypothetical protein
VGAAQFPIVCICSTRRGVGSVPTDGRPRTSTIPAGVTMTGTIEHAHATTE